MNISPCVVWLTGLSGSGKTTISVEIRSLFQGLGIPIVLLDGDDLRKSSFFPSCGYTREDRIAHIRRTGGLAAFLEGQGISVVCALISPYREARNDVRIMCRNFFEVFVNTSIEVCAQRDVKGLYRKVKEGQIAHFTGISDPYEEPQQPDLEIDTNAGQSAQELASEIVHTVLRRQIKEIPEIPPR